MNIIIDILTWIAVLGGAFLFGYLIGYKVKSKDHCVRIKVSSDDFCKKIDDYVQKKIREIRNMMDNVSGDEWKKPCGYDSKDE